MFLREEIDRALELRLRSTVVALGYWTDNLQYLNDAAGFTTAQNAITTAGKKLIQVFGAGSTRQRGRIKAPAFFIDLFSSSVATRYAAPQALYRTITVDGVPQFMKMKLPAVSWDLDYEIRLIADDARYDRLMQAMLQHSFEGHQQLPGISEQGTATVYKFLLSGGDLIDVSQDTELERLLRVRVHNVFILDGLEQPQSVPTLQQATIEISGTTVSNTVQGESNP